MTGHRSNPPADLKVVLQCPLNFLTEVNDRLISALPDNTDPVISEINIFDIESDALGDTDPGSEKKRDKSEVALFCLFIVGKSFSLESLFTVFDVKILYFPVKTASGRQPCNKTCFPRTKTSHTPPQKAGYATIRRKEGRFCHIGCGRAGYFFAEAGRDIRQGLKLTRCSSAARSGALRTSLFTSKIMVGASSGV